MSFFLFVKIGFSCGAVGPNVQNFFVKNGHFWLFQAKNGPFRHVRRNYGSQRRFEAFSAIYDQNYTFLAQLGVKKIFGFRPQKKVRSHLQKTGRPNIGHHVISYGAHVSNRSMTKNVKNCQKFKFSEIPKNVGLGLI